VGENSKRSRGQKSPGYVDLSVKEPGKRGFKKAKVHVGLMLDQKRKCVVTVWKSTDGEKKADSRFWEDQSFVTLEGERKEGEKK